MAVPTTPAELAKKLNTMAETLGAGSHVMDMMIDNVRAKNLFAGCAKLKATAGADLMSVLGAVTPWGAKGSESIKKTVVDGVVNALNAATCVRTGAGMTTQQFATELEKYRPETVVGFPVTMLPVGQDKIRRVVFRVPGAPQATLVVPSSFGGRTSAELRRHSDGRLSFLRRGADVKAVLAITRAAPTPGKSGWMDVEFAQGGGVLSVQATSAEAVPGRKATVFVGAGGRVRQLVKWEALPVTTLVPTPAVTPAVTTAPPVVNGTTAPPVVVNGTTAPPSTLAPAQGTTIDVTLKNTNDTDSGADGTAGGGVGGPFLPVLPVDPLLNYPGVGVPVVVDEGGEGEETAVPEDTTPPEPEPLDMCPATDPCPVVGLDKPGTFFCMTKRTLIIIVVMLVLASCLGGLGYWIYRKRGAAGASGAGAGSGMDDLGLGDLGLAR